MLAAFFYAVHKNNVKHFIRLIKQKELLSGFVFFFRKHPHELFNEVLLKDVYPTEDLYGSLCLHSSL